MKPANSLAVIGLALFSLLASAASVAESKAEIDASVSEARKQFHLLDASHESLEQKAAGVLIFPRVTKGGAGVAGERGEGALQVKGKTVGYYSVTSASIGLTLGVSQRSEIIMFMTQEALDKFTASNGWSIGADTGIALISKGAGGKYDSQTLQKPILGFVFSEKGLMGDLSLQGSNINKIEK